MLIGLIGIPILLSCLGVKGFSAWAVLLGGSFFFYVFEFGMPPTVVKFLTEARWRQDAGRTDAIMSNAIGILAVVFSIGFIGIIAIARPVSAWLNLPGTQLFSRSGLLIVVFVAVTISSLVKMGVHTLYVERRFDLVALIVLYQTLVPSLCSWAAAYKWGRLDIVLVTYWTCQILVLWIAQHLARRVVPWRFDLSVVNFREMWTLLSHGVNLQFNDFVFFSHFQFDKVLIAGLVGLPEVAHYEIAGRAVQSLRNLPGSALSTLLPSATSAYASGTDIWGLYLDMTRTAAQAAILFLLVPLIVSPLFLFAWVGQIGYHGRWIFMWLAVGISAGIITLPVSNFIQAMGRTVLETKFAILSLILHGAISMLLIQHWGKEGVAAGAGLAMLLGAGGYMHAFHWMHGKRISDTVVYLVREFWTVGPVCLIWFGIMTFVKPLVIVSRWYMAPAAVVLYLSCAMTLVTVYVYTGKLRETERMLLRRLVGMRF